MCTLVITCGEREPKDSSMFPQKKEDYMIGEYSILNGRLTYKMPEEIDHHMAKAIAMEIDALIEGGGVRKVVFDMEQTRFMDSSGIGIITRRFRQVYSRRGGVGVINVNERIDKILLMSGIYRIAVKLDECVGDGSHVQWQVHQ
mgnify:CR=1 FL=1